MDWWLLCGSSGTLFFYLSNAIETMHDNSVPASYKDGGGLLFGLFCFYVLCFGVAWYWGSGKREEMRRQAVEDQINRQKAMEALLQLEWFAVASLSLLLSKFYLIYASYEQ